MPKTILITLNNSGNDPGPYDLTLIDGANNQTLWPNNPVTKAQLIAGYQMVVPDLIVKVKVQSKTCTTFVQLTIPTTLCPCRNFDFVNGNYIFHECGRDLPTNLNVGAVSVRYCVNTEEPIIKVSGSGNFADTNICCTVGPPVPTPSTTTTSTTSTTTSTTSSTTTSTTSTTTTTTTTTCNPGVVTWNMNAVAGARLRITRVSDSSLLVNQLSVSGTPKSGSVLNNASCTSYQVQASWVSGSGNSIKMRICNITAGTEFSFDSGSGPGTSFTREITLCCNQQYSISVTAGTDTPFPCPL